MAQATQDPSIVSQDVRLFACDNTEQYTATALLGPDKPLLCFSYVGDFKKRLPVIITYMNPKAWIVFCETGMYTHLTRVLLSAESSFETTMI